MNKHIIRGENRAEFQTRERVFITERLNDPAVPGLSLADARVEAGVTTELHRLTVDEWYVIKRGSGLMAVGGAEWFEVGPGDIVVIPAGTSQSIRNTAGGDLLFQCICTPRFTPDRYEPLE
jgi:mannose-6-phosphate isomerase-like protein (cupin superfamily)